MTSSAKRQKRYQLVLPDDLFTYVQNIAESRQTTVVEMLRRFVKLGLLAVQIEETPGAALMLREGDIDLQITLV